MSRIIVALRTFLHLAMPYFRSDDRWRARGLLAGVIGAELGVVYLAVLVNQWHATFFNAIEARDWNGLRMQLVVFLLLTGGAVLTGMVQFYFGQMLLVRWREWMTQRYVGLWMAEGRHYRIRLTDPSVDNIHLRIASDVMLFIQRALELGIGLLSSFVSLFSFSYILWGLSAIAPLPLFGADLSFPGYLIWAALTYAAVGMVVAHIIGHRLIPLNFRQQRCEADFRFAIARVTDQADPVALMHGEGVERNELRRRFGALLGNWVTLVGQQTRLNGFIFGYYHVANVFPTLVVTPAYLVGAIPLGILMQAALAFQKVESAFAFCTSYAKIAEWKALMDRVAQFEAAMVGLDRPLPTGPAHDVPTASPGDLSVNGVVLRLPSGEMISPAPNLTLSPGQRLVVTGPSGAGKSCLVRAVAGLWPLGGGRVRAPQGARVLALPQRPYFPLGSLKQGLTYPMLADSVDDAEVRAAMVATGLAHLIERMHEESDWSAVLSGGEQQRALFARALINRPTILLLDEPVSMLERAEANDLYGVLVKKLPEAIIISVDGTAAGAVLSGRSIEMIGTPLAGRRRPVTLAAATA